MHYSLFSSVTTKLLQFWIKCLWLFMFRCICLAIYFQLLEYMVMCAQLSIKRWILFHCILSATNELSPYFTSLSQNLVLTKLFSLTFLVDCCGIWSITLHFLLWQLKTSLSSCAHLVVFCLLCWSCIAFMANSEVIWCHIYNIDIKSLSIFKRKDHRMKERWQSQIVK